MRNNHLAESFHLQLSIFSETGNKIRLQISRCYVTTYFKFENNDKSPRSENASVHIYLYTRGLCESRGLAVRFLFFSPAVIFREILRGKPPLDVIYVGLYNNAYTAAGVHAISSHTRLRIQRGRGARKLLRMRTWFPLRIILKHRRRAAPSCKKRPTKIMNFLVNYTFRSKYFL